MKAETVFRAVFMTVLLGIVAVALIAAWAYLAPVIFWVINKTMPDEVNVYSYLNLWTTFEDDPAQLKRLKISGGVAAGVLIFLICMLVGHYRRDNRSLHGEARFANVQEISKAKLFADHGILVGKVKDRFLCLGGQQFVVLAAPTRSGKGVGVIVPNLLNYPDSVVVSDMKQENWRLTAGYRKSCGQEVFLFNPFSENSHRWNPLSYVSADENFRVNDIAEIAILLYPDPDKGDPFFERQARNLFTGLALYLFETPGLPRTIGEVRRQGTGKGQPLAKYLQGIIADRAANGDPLSAVCEESLLQFLSNSENTLLSILASFSAPLANWLNPLVDMATSGDDFRLDDVRKKRMSIYLGVMANKLDVAAFMLNLFYAQLCKANTGQLPEDNPSVLKHQCLLVLDEFTAMGKVPIIEKGCGYFAGFNLRLLIVVQSVAQLQAVYGEHGCKTLMDNSALQVIYPPKDSKDASQVSETIGYIGHISKSKSRNRGESGRSSSGESESEQRRALLLPQEVRAMPQTEELVFMEYTPAIRAEKIIWYNDAAFRDRKVAPPELPYQSLGQFVARVNGDVGPVPDDAARLGPDGELDAKVSDGLAAHVETLRTRVELVGDGPLTDASAAEWVDDLYDAWDESPLQAEAAGAAMPQQSSRVPAELGGEDDPFA